MQQQNNIIQSVNPATEEIIQEYYVISEHQLQNKISNAKESFEEWKNDIDKRTNYLYGLAEEFRKNKENLAQTCTKEMGKAIKESRSEGKMRLGNKIFCG